MISDRHQMIENTELLLDSLTVINGGESYILP